MKRTKTILDERQELKLLNIEHLFGELIVLLCLSIYLLVSCIKNGIWAALKGKNNSQ